MCVYFCIGAMFNILIKLLFSIGSCKLFKILLADKTIPLKGLRFRSLSVGVVKYKSEFYDCRF